MDTVQYAQIVTNITLAVLYSLVFSITLYYYCKKERVYDITKVRYTFFICVCIFTLFRAIYFAIPDELLGLSFNPKHKSISPSDTKGLVLIFIARVVKAIPNVVYFTSFMLVVGFWISALRSATMCESGQILNSPSIYKMFMIANLAVYFIQLVILSLLFYTDLIWLIMSEAIFLLLLSVFSCLLFISAYRLVYNAIEPLSASEGSLFVTPLASSTDPESEVGNYGTIEDTRSEEEFRIMVLANHRLRNITRVAIICVCAYIFRIGFLTYELVLIANNEKFPEYWFVFISLYYFSAEILSSLLVVLSLKKDKRDYSYPFSS